MYDWIGDLRMFFFGVNPFFDAGKDALTKVLNSHSNLCRFPSRKMFV
jgi:hypothetical protein